MLKSPKVFSTFICVVAQNNLNVAALGLHSENGFMLTGLESKHTLGPAPNSAWKPGAQPQGK